MQAFNFSKRVRRVLNGALGEAGRLRHEYIAPEHLLLALLDDDDGVAAAIFAAHAVNRAALARSLDQLLEPGDPLTEPSDTKPYSSRGKKVLDNATVEARDLRHSYVGTEHLLLGLLRSDRGIALQVLTQSGLSLASVRAETIRILGAVPSPRSSTESVRKVSAITIEVQFDDGAIIHETFNAVIPAIGFLGKQS